MITVGKKRPLFLRILFCVLSNALGGYAVYMLLSCQILPIKYIYIAIGAIALLNLFVDFFLLFFRGNRLFRVIGYFFSIIAILVSAAGIYILNDTIGTLTKITSSKITSISISVIVKKDSNIYLTPQLKDISASAVKSLEDQYVTDITKDLNLGDVTRLQSYTDLAKGIYDGSLKAVLFNESYRDLIKSEYPDFDTAMRVVKQYSFDAKAKMPVSLMVQNRLTYILVGSTLLAQFQPLLCLM